MPRPAQPERSREFVGSPMLAVAVCLAAGIALAQPQRATLAGTLLEVPWLLALAGVAMLAGLMLLRAQRVRLAGAATLVGFLLAGAAAARLFEFRFPPHHASHLESQGIDLNGPVRLAGRLANSPVRTPHGWQFDLELLSIEDRGQMQPWSGKVRLRMENSSEERSAAFAESLHLRSGDAIRVLARLERPRVYHNPGSFDFRRWMETIEDVYWVGTIKSPLLVEQLSGRDAPALTTFSERVRQRLLAGIDRMYPPWSAEGRGGAVLKAVLLGDRSSLDSDTIENFRQSGLYHLLVISGLHVGLLAMLAALCLRLLPFGEMGRSALLVLFLFGYLSLVELRAPTLRATLMISLYLLARFFYRRHSALNAVGLAALLLLLARPAWLFESGFELSFAAALLIVGLAVPILERTTEPYRRALRSLGEVGLDETFAPRHAQFRLDARRLAERVASWPGFLKNRPAAARAAVTLPLRGLAWTVNILFFTAILQIGLLLPMAETFHRVTFAGIGLNTLAIPLMTLLLAVAVPTVILGALAPALAVWPAKLLAAIMSALFALTDLPHLPPWLSYRVPAPPAWVAWGFAGSVVVAAVALGRRARIFWTGLAAWAVFAALVSIHPFPPQLPRGKLEVTALDCGDGDAEFVVLPDQTTLLVNACGSQGRAPEVSYAGRRWDPGENIVSPYLWSRGVEQIDFLVSSQAHGGRLSGLAAIARNFRVKEFWQIPSPGSRAYAQLLEQVQARGIPIRSFAAGDVLREGQASIQFLWPPPLNRMGAEGGGGARDDSLVLRISQGAASTLIAGGFGRQLELIGKGGFEESEALVLASPGDEALRSAEFLARLSPRVVLVGGAEKTAASADRAPLRRLPVQGAQLFETWRDGAVRVEMEGSSLAVRTYRASAGEGRGGGTAAGSPAPSSFKLP